MVKSLRIRHYVIGLMHRAGHASVQIMSATEMAKHFGIARSTVCIALKELTEDGYLVSKPGIGTFTNPHRLIPVAAKQNPRLTGGIIGDGQSYYLQQSGWKSLAPLGYEATRNGMYFRPVSLSSRKESELLTELFDMNLDALLWIDYTGFSERCAQQIARRIPFVCDNIFLSGVNVVGYDIAAAWYDIGRNFAALGKRNILICLYDWPCRHEIPYFRKAFEDIGIPVKLKLLFPESRKESFLEKTSALLKKNSYDLCISHLDYLDFFRSEAPAGTEVFEYWHYRSENGLPMCYTFPHEKRAARMMERIRAIWAGDSGIQKILIPMTKNITEEGVKR